jgi:hypothetical protein
LFAPTPSWAHQAVTAPAVSAATVTYSSAPHDDTVIASLLFAALVALIGSALRRPRRLVAGLTILLLVLTFEAGLHSAHHVGELDQSAACVVAMATAHLVGSPVDAVTVDPVAAPLLHATLSAPPVRVPLHRPTSHKGRAPPDSIV